MESQLSSASSPIKSCSASAVPVPVEIVTDDEMAFLEAALASARPLLSSPSRLLLASSSLPLVLSPSRSQVTSIRSCSNSPVRDIEDSDQSMPPRSYLERFRANRALSVTDITGSVRFLVSAPKKHIFSFPQIWGFYCLIIGGLYWH